MSGDANDGAGGGDGIDGNDRMLVVDANVFITLAAVDAVDLLDGLDGRVVIPERVADELVDDRSQAAFAAVRERDGCRVVRGKDRLDDARTHLGDPGGDAGGVGVLALALDADGRVVAVTDDKPLRKVCKALSIPVSGSIGVLVRAVERGTLDGDEAIQTLYAMDEVGARLSASLVRRAERLIDDADG
jgi:predicted nucleic acid-binding protein